MMMKMPIFSDAGEANNAFAQRSINILLQNLHLLQWRTVIPRYTMSHIAVNNVGTQSILALVLNDDLFFSSQTLFDRQKSRLKIGFLKNDSVIK